MKQQQPTSIQQIANLFRDVSQDVSQLNKIVIHKYWLAVDSSICQTRSAVVAVLLSTEFTLT